MSDKIKVGSAVQYKTPTCTKYGHVDKVIQRQGDIRVRLRNGEYKLVKASKVKPSRWDRG